MYVTDFYNDAVSGSLHRATSDLFRVQWIGRDVGGGDPGRNWGTAIWEEWLGTTIKDITKGQPRGLLKLHLAAVHCLADTTDWDLKVK